MSGLDLGQFKSLIVTPALTSVGLGGQTAINLVTGTALKESGLQYLKQLGTGPALGVCQMEPATHDYLWTLKSMKSTGSLRARIVEALNLNLQPVADQLVSDLYYAVIMCRIKYLSVAEPLPANNATSLATYWKSIYNSSLGAGVVDSATVSLFQQAIAA
jgi:hypothetical protein